MAQIFRNSKTKKEFFLIELLYIRSLINKNKRMISVDGLTVEFGGTTLFKDISFAINEKDRIALMGKNGAGKSTLLKIIAGERKPSAGRVSAPKGNIIAYLPQHLITTDNRTVFEETSQAFAGIFEMQNEIEKINQQLNSRTDYDSPEYFALIEQIGRASCRERV